MNARFALCIAAVAGVFTAGCGPKVMVPPRIDLEKYQAVGVIDFTSNTQGSLEEYATQKFLEIVGESQPRARFIELGDQKEVLESVKMAKMDRDAVQAIGERHKVSAVIIGNLEVSDVTPRVDVGFWFHPVSVEAEVDASMTSKLLETSDGATVWTGSARDKATVAEVGIFSPGVFIFDAENPDKAYGKLVESLVRDVSRDLRVTYR